MSQRKIAVLKPETLEHVIFAWQMSHVIAYNAGITCLLASATPAGAFATGCLSSLYEAGT